MAVRHFLSLLDLSPDELKQLIQRGIELKRLQHAGTPHPLLKNKVLAMIFEKSSTRTRVSFESAMAHVEGHALFLSPRDTQLGRGEPVEDTARVLAGMVDGVMIRTFEQTMLERFAEYSKVPVINGLTDALHPCQLLADMQTYHEHRGSIEGKTVTWIGDGFNMCHSYINAARQYGFHLNIATPKGYEPDAQWLDPAAHCTTLGTDPHWAVAGADLVVTDVWSSMGQEEEQKQRMAIFAPYQVDADMMAKANSDAVFMHCLPAHRGEEVSAEVMDSAQSVVWDEAENRLHAQKALLEFLMAT